MKLKCYRVFRHTTQTIKEIFMRGGSKKRMCCLVLVDEEAKTRMGYEAQRAVSTANQDLKRGI